MIDTLKVRLHAPKFQRGCDLQHAPGTTNLRTGERSAETRLFRAGDVDIVGAKAWHNGEDFHVTVQPRRGNEDVVDTTVHVSVPAIAHGGCNFAPTDKDGTARVLDGLGERLRSIGIECDVYRSYVSRTDFFRNAQLDHDIRDYHGLFSAMTPQRMSPADYGTGYRWGNSAQQICVYSKVEEMEIKARKSRREFNPEKYPANVLRCEWRVMGRDKSKTALGVETVSDLMDAYDTIPMVYRRQIKKQMFSRDVKDARRVVTVAEAEAGMRYFKDRGERFWVERFWGALPFAELGGAEIAAIEEAAARVAGNRETLRRVRNKLRQHKLDAAAVKRAARNRPTGAELYSELKRKIIEE